MVAFLQSQYTVRRNAGLQRAVDRQPACLSGGGESDVGYLFLRWLPSTRVMHSSWIGAGAGVAQAQRRAAGDVPHDRRARKHNARPVVRAAKARVGRFGITG
jgi:hypothetical protein